jgi:hypothetical protein
MTTPLATPAGLSRSPVPSPTGPEASAADRPGDSAAFAPPPGDDGGPTGSPAAPADGRLVAGPPIEGDGAALPTVPVGLGALGLLGSIDVWIVPGLLLGVPGLLVVAFVLLQAIGALAWIPAIKRLRGDQEAEPAAA